MKTETVDQIAWMVRHFATVLVVLTGLQSVCGAIDVQLGPFAAFVALVCVGLSWQAPFLRDLTWQHPRLFVAILVVCAIAMTVMIMAVTPMPPPADPAPLG
jgi:ABC-type Fe3+-siderophore transport system permease subunit